MTLFYDDSTDAIENRLLLLENTFAIEDVIGVDLIINSSITISTSFTLTINQANRSPTLKSDVSSIELYYLEGVSQPQSIVVTDYFVDLDLDNIVWTLDGNTSFTIDVDDDFVGWTSVQNVGSTRYSNSFTAYDGKVNSSDFITLHVNIEEALTPPVVPSNLSLIHI